MEEKKKKQSVQTIQTKTRVEKGKSGIASVIFGRTGIILLLVLLQAFFLIAGYTYLQGKMYFIDSIVRMGAVLLVIYLTNNRSNPAFKMVWMTIMLVAPVFGVLLYIFVEMQVGVRWLNARLQHMHEMTRHHWTQDEKVREALKKEDSEVASLAHYVYEYGGFPAYENTGIQYFHCGEDKIEELIRQLEKAQKFIFMEYFIVAKGYVWDRVLEVLKRKAAEGVEVRFMYDGMCAISMLPYDYPEKLKHYGIQCKMANAVKPFLSTTQNNRDHRKICVIDGKTAFTGGINIGDEYINRKERFGHWKDTAIMLKGDAVQSFTMMFLEMWNVDERYSENYHRYLTPKRRELHREYGYIIPYADSPYDDENVGEEVYFHILNHARKYVHIMTPYLILDNEMITTLTRVAKSGVEVSIIMPHIPDKWYAFAVAKTYYKELIEGGVRIYEYEPGFVHAKVFVADDDTASVGTINLDYRSLYLHFECGAFIYNNSEIDRIERDFQETLEKCHKVTLMEVKNRSLLTKIVGQVLKLVAPLM